MVDLKKELSGNLEDAVLALFYTTEEYDAEQLKKAMKGMGTDEGTLIEIIASRANWSLKQIKEQYKIKYGKELEDVIKKETTGDLQRLLISLLQCNRSENTHINQSDCEAKVKELFDAGEAKWGTDSEVYNKYLL